VFVNWTGFIKGDAPRVARAHGVCVMDKDITTEPSEQRASSPDTYPEQLLVR
jgi:hypothetical protein